MRVIKMNDIENAIAIVGIDLNLPGCKDLNEFWNVVLNSVECIKDIPNEYRSGVGVEEQEQYVNRMSVCEDYDKFDAQFFGYSRHEAKVMDPQHRLFLQSCWKAIENAGYKVSELQGNVGVYGSVGYNTYLIQSLMEDSNYVNKQGYYDVLVGNDKDYFSTRVSYKLGLTGPSMTVQTACSSSLLGVHLACQSLLMGESDMCLAGGACVRVPCEQGYVAKEGFILSKDGHCRSFDEKGTGTVFGSGVGVVVLKRLEDAIESKDTIFSIIRASAVNNDGNRKIGFTAPSFEGQTDVTQTALGLEGIEPKSIRFIEAHGTGTVLGDPIELNSIMNTFHLDRDEENEMYPCAIGSVKSNIGHLDAAAGVAGLIKASLCLYYKKIVPTLHFTELNHRVSFKNTRFYIADKVEDLQDTEYPIRAAVSAFGVGGTNVSVILEESPQKIEYKNEKDMYIAVLSAKTKNSLQQMVKNVKTIEANLSLASTVYTLDTAREEFDCRTYCILARQNQNTPFQIIKESEICSVAENQESQVVLELGEKEYPEWETLYHENNYFSTYVDVWMKELNQNGIISSQNCKEVWNEKNEFLQKTKGIILQIAFIETIKEYCENVICVEPKVMDYLSGNVTKKALLQFYSNEVSDKVKTDAKKVKIECISLLSMYEILGTLWKHGLIVKWDKLFLESEKWKVPAPTYAFEKTRYWYKEKQSLTWEEEKIKLSQPIKDYKGTYIFFGQEEEEKELIWRKMKKKGLSGFFAKQALESKEGYQECVDERIDCACLEEKEQLRLVFLFHANQINSVSEEFLRVLKKIQYVNRTFTKCKAVSVILVQVLSKEAQPDANSMLFVGLVKTLPKEMPHVQVKQVLCNEVSDAVLNELFYDDIEMQVYIRENERYGVNYKQKEIDTTQALLKNLGTYVITGGTGNVGLLFAIEIAKRVRANIILISQHYSIDDILQGNSEKLKKVKDVINELRKKNAQVEVLQADITNSAEWKYQIEQLEERYGKINGIIHAAGKVGKAHDFVEQITLSTIKSYMAAKVEGAFLLNQIFADKALDFCIYISSTVSLLGGIGDSVYSGANAVLNEIANYNMSKHGVEFAVILDYMPRIWEDEFVLEADNKVRNLLAGQLSRVDFSIACDKIFSNQSGGNLIIAKTDFKQRFEREKEIRKQNILLASSKTDPLEVNYQQVQIQVQEVWKKILESDCDVSRNFFDAGGDSFLAVKLIGELNRIFSMKLPIQYVYEFTTIKLMAQNIYEEMKEMRYDEKNFAPVEKRKGGESAYVVGMAGKFPDADNVDELWDNLMKKKQSITHFVHDESLNVLNAETDGKYNQYVGARGIINDVDKFDYQFFGISKLEAEVMDPQQRIFIQLVWNAFEDAGCINLLEEAKVGVFASQGISTYLVNVLLQNDKIKKDYNNIAVINNSQDALATRVSYLFNLTGVSKTVQTFCSSSLVALEEAVEHIERGTCDLAVVGGVNIVVPQRSGYIYNEGAIYSNTGEVKPFDEAANGTVFSNGAGVVILASESLVKEKRLHSYAKVLGIGINNDGSQKASFLSPSVKGQARCIEEAYQKAGIKPSQVSYVETHGTATNVGDPIEVHALERVFLDAKEKKSYCALGSIKGNIGHLDRAAGITSFIKGCLVAEKYCIPPVAGYETTNKKIKLEDSPFYINKEAVQLEKEKELYIGISALGVGGTNVHVVIQSTDSHINQEQQQKKYLIPISAKCQESFTQIRRTLLEYLEREDVGIEQMANTMQLRRRHFSVREMIIAENKYDLIEALEKNKVSMQNKKVNTILFTYSLSEQAMCMVVQKLLEQEKWFVQTLLKEYELQDVNMLAEEYSRYGRKIFEVCMDKGISNLLSEKVVILFREQGTKEDIHLDERAIHVVITEQYMEKCTSEKTNMVMLTPTDVSAFSEVLATLWSSGLEIDWERYNWQNELENIHLPGYAFKKTICWI